jgi:hypothetical protein
VNVRSTEVFWIFVATGALFLALAMAVGSLFACVLGVGLLLYAENAWHSIQLQSASNGFSLHRLAEGAKGVQGQTVVLKAELEGRSLVHIASDLGSGPMKAEWETVHESAQYWQGRVHLTSPRLGSGKLNGIWLTWRNPNGWFECTEYIPCPTEILWEAEVTPSGDFPPFPFENQGPTPGENDREFRGLRPWRSGDRLGDVHRRASARSGRTFVADYRPLPPLHRVLIVGPLSALARKDVRDLRRLFGGIERGLMVSPESRAHVALFEGNRIVGVLSGNLPFPQIVDRIQRLFLESVTMMRGKSVEELALARLHLRAIGVLEKDQVLRTDLFLEALQRNSVPFEHEKGLLGDQVGSYLNRKGFLQPHRDRLDPTRLKRLWPELKSRLGGARDVWWFLPKGEEPTDSDRVLMMGERVDTRWISF